jgi:1,4-dihydroxy-2-naphthoate octaprenyltransferase
MGYFINFSAQPPKNDQPPAADAPESPQTPPAPETDLTPEAPPSAGNADNAEILEAAARAPAPEEPSAPEPPEAPAATPAAEPAAASALEPPFRLLEEKDNPPTDIVFPFKSKSRPWLQRILKLAGSWWQASRPSFFLATIFPVTLGFLVAREQATALGGSVSFSLFAMILVACFLVHMATNISNDYFEHREGVDTPESLGGSRVIQEGKLSPRAIRYGIIFCYAVSFVLAIFIVKTNKVLWILTVFAAFSSFFYVAPPLKYGHRALGELMVFLNMGVIMVVGTYLALILNAFSLEFPDAPLAVPFDKNVLAMALPSSFMVAAILYFQSLPEIDEDRRAGKITLAGLLGKERAALAFLLWWPLVWLLTLSLYWSGLVGWPALLGILAIPLHASVCRKINRAENWPELDKYGYLVRIVYFITSFALIAGVIYK